MIIQVIDHEQLDEIKDILGDKVEGFITRYINDTKADIAEIEILRASGQEKDIIRLVHNFKSSSFQAGALAVSKQSAVIESFLNEYADNLHLLHIQTRLDDLLKILRDYFVSYEQIIFDYLKK